MKKLQCIVKILLIVVLNNLSIVSFSQIVTDSLYKNAVAINVFNYQNLQFGVFSQGTSGGTITISPDGIRSTTGDIVPLNFGSAYFASIFEIEAPKSSIISILNGANAILNGSNGGTMTLKIDLSNPRSPFPTTIDPPGRTLLRIGGTLTVGNASSSPPGIYTGEFNISFVVE